MAAIRTNHISGLIPETTATEHYNHLLTSVSWQDGIPSRKTGFTRKAYALPPDEQPKVWQLVTEVVGMFGLDINKILGIYLNLYRNGEDYTPGHSHPGMRQIVISLGASRTLYIKSGSTPKNYLLSHGDVIIFGSGMHGVPKEPLVHTSRISIAVFLEK